MTEIQRVHERLMSQLPVRTVPTRREFDGAPSADPISRRCGRPRTEEVLDLNRRITRLRQEGHTCPEIMATTGASEATVARHLKGQVATIAKHTNSQQRRDAAKRR